MVESVYNLVIEGNIMAIYLTSDWHHAHKNIIKYNNRPYSDLDEMHWNLIKNHNSRVTPQDTTYFLGDFSFATKFEDIENFIHQLNGKKILVFGNHDKPHRKDYIKSNLFETCTDYVEENFVLDGKKVLVVMSHFPFLSWNKGHHGSLMLHGHCHSDNKMNINTRRYDVGADGNNYFPISMEEIWDKVKGNEPIKHH